MSLKNRKIKCGSFEAAGSLLAGLFQLPTAFHLISISVNQLGQKGIIRALTKGRFKDGTN